MPDDRMNIYGLDWGSLPNARDGDDIASYLQREGAPGAAALKKAFAEAPLLGHRTIGKPQTNAQRLRERFK